MIQRMLASGLIAGFGAGLLAALLHFAFVQNVLLLGEDYESGALVHFDGAAGQAVAGADGDGHAHDHGDGHANGQDGHGDGDGKSDLLRNALTVLFTAAIYAGYGLVLVAGFALAECLGRTVTAREGVLWGIAGFAGFQLAPAMGLAPELPGTIAADFDHRQMWWLGTVAATVAGLALLAYGRGIALLLVGAALLAAPHVIGAPQPEQFWGVAPPEVGAEFAARVLGVGLVAWATLGALSGRLWAARPA